MDIQEDIYYQIIRQKTASLIAACCACGAASVGATAEMVKSMREFGENIGIAFQIKDDLFDYGLGDKIGKPVGIDIKERKMTLPLIYALQHCDGKQKRRIINIVKNNGDDKDKVQEVLDFVAKSGGIGYAKSAMIEYQQKAFAILDSLPENKFKSSLKELVIYTIERDN